MSPIDDVLWKEAGYVIAIMNMILHGIEAPSIIHTNTLTEEVVHRSPQDIMDEIAALDGESADVLATIRWLL